MCYDVVLFDLDGTLTDSQEGIWNSFRYALSAYDVEPPDMRLLLGPPLAYSFRTLCGLRDEDIEPAIARYREYFGTKGILENRVYAGVPEMLNTLKDKGKKLILATSKAEVYAYQILRHFDLLHYFDFVGGSELNNTRTTKAEVIAYVLEGAGIVRREGILMVGDRFHDVEGAKAMSLPCAGVLYGYGTERELREAGADFLVAEPMELVRITG